MASFAYSVAASNLVAAALADADATKTLAQGSEFTLPAGTLTANRSITLSTSGAVTGDVVRVVRQDVTAFTLAVINGGAGAGTKYTFPASVARVADFRFDGTNWVLAGHARITP